MYDSDDLPLTDIDYDILGMGLRNPFRAAVDKLTGDIYIADVGHITVEARGDLLSVHGTSRRHLEDLNGSE